MPDNRSQRLSAEHLVFQHSSDVAVVLRIDDQRRPFIEDANATALEALGTTASELKTAYLDELILRPGFAHLRHSVSRLLQGCQQCLTSTLPFVYEHAASLQPGQEPRQYRIRLSPLADDHGITHIIVIANDITAAKLHEAELIRRAELEARMSSFFLSAPGDFFTIIYKHRQPLTIQFASAGFRQAFGVPDGASVIRLRTLLGRVHPDDTGGVLAELDAAMRKSRSFHIELRLIDTNGDDRWVEVRSSPRPVHGEGITWDGFVVDVSQRKAVEVALANREAEYRALVDNTPEPLMRVHTDGAFELLNPAARTLLGGTTQYYVELMELAARVSSTGRAAACDFAIRDQEMHMRHFQCHAVPEVREEAAARSVLLIATDVTQLKKNAEYLARSRRTAEQLIRHSDTIREEERRYLAQEIHEELGQFLTSLHLGISALSIEFGGQLPAMKVHTGELLRLVERTLRSTRALVSRLRPTALDKGIDLGLAWLVEHFCHYSGFAPDLRIHGDTTLLGDEQATTLFRICQEALTNIARHAKATRACVSLTELDGAWRLSVSDNGIGFDVSVVRDDSFGLLGMAERAASLGGTMDISSTSQRGTEVLMVFPVRAEAMNQPPAVSGNPDSTTDAD